MSIAPTLAGVVIVGTFAALLLSDGSQAERNAAAQAAAAQTYPVPAYSKMLNAQIAAREAAAGPHAAKTSSAAAGVTLRSVGFDLPASDRAFPPGPNMEMVANNCAACHSPGMILSQPPLTAAAWTGEVNKMRSTYKAPVPEADVPQIVAYLAALPVAK